jgi:K+-sensing histidine kinase KdpD
MDEIELIEHIEHEILQDDEHNSLVLDSMHELRYFNQRLKNLTEQLTIKLDIKNIGTDKPLTMKAAQADEVRLISENILNLSQLFTTRLDFIDVELNPSVIEQLDIGDVSIYAKFDKARRMLNSLARTKKVKINILGDTKVKRLFNAYSIIDILPYLILDNAVKYCPQKTEVDIEFIFYDGCIEVSVSSMGPFVPSHELSQIKNKNYRGSNALLLDNVVGRGLGLYYVNYICDLHDIKISFSSDKYTFEMGGVPFSCFTTTLKIPN